MNLEQCENYVENLTVRTREGLMRWRATSHPDIDPRRGCYHSSKGCVDLLLIGGTQNPSVSIVDRNGRFIPSKLGEVNACVFR